MSQSTPSSRLVNDPMLGPIDLDRMERAMNAEVAAMRASGGAFVQPQMLIDHFTRNSPQAVLLFMHERLSAVAQERFVAALRAVMYEPGQTVVPQGYGVVATESGGVRLVPVS